MNTRNDVGDGSAGSPEGRRGTPRRFPPNREHRKVRARFGTGGRLLPSPRYGAQANFGSGSLTRARCRLILSLTNPFGYRGARTFRLPPNRSRRPGPRRPVGAGGRIARGRGIWTSPASSDRAVRFVRVGVFLLNDPAGSAGVLLFGTGARPQAARRTEAEKGELLRIARRAEKSQRVLRDRARKAGSRSGPEARDSARRCDDRRRQQVQVRQARAGYERRTGCATHALRFRSRRAVRGARTSLGRAGGNRSAPPALPTPASLTDPHGRYRFAPSCANRALRAGSGEYPMHGSRLNRREVGAHERRRRARTARGDSVRGTPRSR